MLPVPRQQSVPSPLHSCYQVQQTTLYPAAIVITTETIIMKHAGSHSLNEQEALITYGLAACCRFEGMSVPPICAVQPILDRQCKPCHMAANRASDRLHKERRSTRNIILHQEHEHLQAVLRYYQNLSSNHDAENNAIKAAVCKKQQERDELAQRHDIQQQWERRG